jgi:hypothetical protein
VKGVVVVVRVVERLEEMAVFLKIYLKDNPQEN